MADTIKHTPGPWELDNSDGTIRSKQFASSDQMGDFRGVVVCDMAAGLGTKWGHPARAHALPETLANAQLIAAAPELLAALENMRDMTQSGWITPEDKPTDWQLGWEARANNQDRAHERIGSRNRQSERANSHGRKPDQ